VPGQRRVRARQIAGAERQIARPIAPDGVFVKRRIRFTDAERRELAVLGKKVGRKVLAEVATIATLEMILRWYRVLERSPTRY
jgi:hypothetical protein